MIYQAEKTIKDLDGKGDADTVTKVQEAIEVLKKTMETENVEDIKRDTEALSKPLYELSAALYKEQQAQEGAAAEGAEQAKPHDENVVDAEIVDEKTKK